MKIEGLVSVIIPVYNSSRFICNCIENVQAQTYLNTEIIVVNDGSTDNTLDLLNQIKDSRLKIIDIPNNNGVSNARSIGLEHAMGEYILFVDADDYMEPNTIEILQGLMHQQEIDIIRFNGYIEDQHHQFKKLEFPIRDHTIYDSRKNSVAIIDLLNNPSQSIRCYSPLLFLKNNRILPFNTNLSYLEDKLFYMENLLNNKKILFVDIPLYYYLYNESSKTKDQSKFLKNLKDIMASKPYILKVAEQYKYSNKHMIESSYGSLVMYRLDYFLQKSNYLQSRQILKEILEDPEILNILISSKDYLPSFKKMQMKLLTGKHIYFYYTITKLKEWLKNRKR